MAQLIGQVVFAHCKIQLNRPLKFPGDAANFIIQSDVIPHVSLVYVLCHGYQWYLIEMSGELPTCLFTSFDLSQKQMWQTYISICSISYALQDAIALT